MAQIPSPSKLIQHSWSFSTLSPTPYYEAKLHFPSCTRRLDTFLETTTCPQPHPKSCSSECILSVCLMHPIQPILAYPIKRMALGWVRAVLPHEAACAHSVWVCTIPSLVNKSHLSAHLYLLVFLFVFLHMGRWEPELSLASSPNPYGNMTVFNSANSLFHSPWGKGN